MHNIKALPVFFTRTSLVTHKLYGSGPGSEERVEVTVEEPGTLRTIQRVYITRIIPV